METLSEHSNWIADGTFYVSPRIFPQSYTIHSVVDNKCVPLVYILSGDKLLINYLPGLPGLLFFLHLFQ